MDKCECHRVYGPPVGGYPWEQEASWQNLSKEIDEIDKFIKNNKRKNKK
jgi:hypothetical protein